MKVAGVQMTNHEAGVTILSTIGVIVTLAILLNIVIHFFGEENAGAVFFIIIFLSSIAFGVYLL